MANKAIKSRAALVKALQDVTEDAPAAVIVKIGGTMYTVAGGSTYIGVAGGKDFGSVTIGNDTLLLAFDHRSGASTKTARLLSELDAEKIGAIAADMLPVPEPPKPPEEAQAALQTLMSMRASGWKIGVDAKGNPVLVPSDEKPKRTRATKGTAEPKKENPPLVIEVGKKIKPMKKDDVYTISNIDTDTGIVHLEPITGGALVEKKLLNADGSGKYANVLKQHWVNVE